ncbi:hypothetical protein PALB_820 [Pseudoalteromonas luteoviolacea B = ATCC 29581]|nr:hypothetical protein PALB_820 [Pseudoalteromonas luteoviolacea B = ATCC 29581]
MLLNTVVITINQCLPIALLWVLLRQSLVMRPITIRHSLIASVVGLFISFAYLTGAGVISQWFDYRGYELSQMGLFFLLYLGLLISCVRVESVWPSVTLVVGITLYLSNFLTYLVSYYRADTAQALWIGTILGLGICFSLCTLLYFFFTSEAAKPLRKIIMLVFACHAASKLVMALDLATQIDVIPSSQSVFDLRAMIDEHSVSGRLLKILVGFEASPSILSLGVFVMSTLFILGVLTFVARVGRKSRSKTCAL